MRKTKEHIFDELLVLQFQSGNTKALSLLVKRWHKRLLIHSNRFVKNPEVAKDIVQDCWVIVFKRLEVLRDPSVFGVWIMSIVAKKSVDWIRKQQKNRALKESINQNLETFDEKDEAIIKIKKIIKTLSQKQQIVIQLFYIERYTIKEIGTILSLSIGTVKSRLFHAREQIKKMYH